MNAQFGGALDDERKAMTAFRQYARQHIPAAQRASSLDDLIAGSAIKLAPTEKIIPPEQHKLERAEAEKKRSNALINYAGKDTESLE